MKIQKFQHLTVVTQNIKGNEINEKYNVNKKQPKKMDFDQYKGYDLTKLSNEYIDLGISPDIISLIEVHISDIRKFYNEKTVTINNVSYLVFTPKMCTNYSDCYKTSLGTCIFVREEIADSFEIRPPEIVIEAMEHKNIKCDIRECRIYSRKLNLEIVSIYVKTGISLGDKKSKITLQKLLQQLQNKLQSTPVIFLGDFNLNVNKKISKFGNEVEEFRDIFKKYEPWCHTYGINDINNIYTHIVNHTKEKVKIDYIVSNLQIQQIIPFKSLFTDHKTLAVIYQI